MSPQTDLEWFVQTMHCPWCEGFGYHEHVFDVCGMCAGTGIVLKSRVFDFDGKSISVRVEHR